MAWYSYSDDGALNALSDISGHKYTAQEDESFGKIFMGWRIINAIGIELQYSNFGTLNLYENNDQMPIGNVSIESYSISADIGYTFPMGIRPYVIIGETYIKANANNLLKLKSFGIRYGYGIEMQLGTLPIAVRLSNEFEQAMYDEKLKSVDYNEMFEATYISFVAHF